VLCGRATWQDGIPAYGKGGAPALEAWLKDRGRRNIEALNQVLGKGAKPWYDFYGGLDKIEVVDGPPTAVPRAELPKIYAGRVR
jgi:tagatose 1,6-diphosphate aldolase